MTAITNSPYRLRPARVVTKAISQVRQLGFILPITLMVLVIVSLLSLSQLQSVWLLSQSTRLNQQQHHEVYQLEAVGFELLQKPLTTSCLGPPVNLKTVVNYMKQGKACVYRSNKIEYRYYWEDLGRYDCWQVLDHGILSSSRHYRLTVYAMDHHQAMQVGLIRAVHGDLCKDETLTIKSGIQAWQFIDLIFS